MSNDTREEYSVDGLNWIDNESNDEGMTLFGLPFDPSIYLFKRVRDLQQNRVLRFDNLDIQQETQTLRTLIDDLATMLQAAWDGLRYEGDASVSVRNEEIDDLLKRAREATL
jgi:hypothetical protein